LKAQQNLQQTRRLAEAAVPLSAPKPHPAPLAPASDVPASEAPAPSVITPNATLDAIAPGSSEPRSLASAEAQESAPPRAEAAASTFKAYKLELSNGDGVDRMARRVADYLARRGSVYRSGRLAVKSTMRRMGCALSANRVQPKLSCSIAPQCAGLELIHPSAVRSAPKRDGQELSRWTGSRPQHVCTGPESAMCRKRDVP
jgi:hypothetical protein